MSSNETATESKVGLERRSNQHGHGQKEIIHEAFLPQNTPKTQSNREEEDDESASHGKTQDREEGSRQTETRQERDRCQAKGPREIEGACPAQSSEGFGPVFHEEGRASTGQNETPRKADRSESGKESDQGRRHRR